MSDQTALVDTVFPEDHTLVQASYKRDAQWTSALMVTGFSCAFLGIWFATSLGVTKEPVFEELKSNPAFYVKEETLNFIGEPYPSGQVYFAATISEMVCDPSSASGKCFLAFMSIAAFSLMFSTYASKLKSVSVGSTRCCCYKNCCLVDHARNVLPSIGILLVAYIYIKPANYTPADNIALAIHTIGANTFIGGYGVLEAYCLYQAKKGNLPVTPGAFKVRIAFLIGLALAGVTFMVGASVYPSVPKDEDLASPPSWCCGDVWRVPTDEDLAKALSINATFQYAKAKYAQDMGLDLLYNTAYGQGLAWKKICFWGEAFSGVFMGLSLVTIWWNADEFKPNYIFSSADLLGFDHRQARALKEEEESGEDDAESDE